MNGAKASDVLQEILDDNLVNQSDSHVNTHCNKQKECSVKRS